MHDNKHEGNHALLRSSASGIHAARNNVLRNEARYTARRDDCVSRCTLKRTNQHIVVGQIGHLMRMLLVVECIYRINCESQSSLRHRGGIRW